VQTVNLRLSAVRRFYAWLIEEGATSLNPAANVRTEAERHFAVLEERWLNGKAEPLIKRIEEIADAL